MSNVQPSASYWVKNRPTSIIINTSGSVAVHSRPRAPYIMICIIRMPAIILRRTQARNSKSDFFYHAPCKSRTNYYVTHARDIAAMHHISTSLGYKQRCFLSLPVAYIIIKSVFKISCMSTHFHIFSCISTHFHVFPRIFTYFYVFSHIFINCPAFSCISTYFHVFSHIFEYFHIFFRVLTHAFNG